MWSDWGNYSYPPDCSAASAWHGGLDSARQVDRQRINSLFTRAKRYSCAPDLPIFDELCETADEQHTTELLFNKINNYNHVLTSHHYVPTSSRHL